MPTIPASRRIRSYPRLSLRTLIVLILVIGAALGLAVRGAHRQQSAVAAIRKAGGSVKYEWEWNNGRPILDARNFWPKWLIDRVGIDYFDNVVQANPAQGASDVELLQIGRLTRLEGLALRDAVDFRSRLRPACALVGTAKT